MTTVVFADLVGSTSLFDRVGDEVASRFVQQLMATLRPILEQHQGRVVKLLGDGLFVVFEAEAQALTACTQMLNHLCQQPMRAAPNMAPAQMQIGIASGEVVELAGDCFGDTVNSAARLADLAGASQILTTEQVWSVLSAAQKLLLRDMGPIFLRGRSEASHVYRVEWQSGRNEEATMAGRSMLPATPRVECLKLVHGTHSLRLVAGPGKALLGRAPEADLVVNDPRVSRSHAMVEWRGGYFVLTDLSSHGSWVYLGNQSDAVLLRRTECYLVGSGHIVLGGDPSETDAPVVNFGIAGAGVQP